MHGDRPSSPVSFSSRNTKKESLSTAHKTEGSGAVEGKGVERVDDLYDGEEFGGEEEDVADGSLGG